MLKFWKVKGCREVLGNPIITIFLHLTFIYLYLVFITVIAVWQLVHLGTHSAVTCCWHSKRFCVNISRKIQKQYDRNKNHVIFTHKSIPSFLNFSILESGHQQKIVPAKILKFGHP